MLSWIFQQCTGRERPGTISSRRAQGLREHSTNRVRRPLDAEQRAKRRNHVHWFRMGTICSRLEGSAVEREWDMSVVAVRRRVVSPGGVAYDEGRQLA